MIIETFDEPRTMLLRTTWKFKDSEQEYQTSSTVCENPFCGCAEMTFGIGLTPHTPPIASFSFDAGENKVTRTGSGNTSDALSERLVAELTPQDHEILLGIFHSRKEELENDLDISTVRPPWFPAQEIERDSVLIDFKEIFPWAKEYWFAKDGVTYFLVQQYCVKSDCRCRDVCTVFMGFRDGTQIKGRDSAAMYKYPSGTWKVISENKGAHSVSALMRAMLEKYPDIGNTFRKRHNLLKDLYRRHREANEPAKAVTRNRPPSVSAGRNGPCPCGSGRKFKKCCGRGQSEAQS